MKKGFTLIEVIISVVILSLVGVALLKSGAMNLSNMEKIAKKEEFVDYISIVVNHRNPDFNHLTKALIDFLPEINIEDDELRKILKKKFKYQEYEIKLTPPTLEGFDEENFSDEIEFVDNEEEDNNDKDQFQSPFEVALIKLSLQNEEGGDYIYILELRE